MKVYSINKNTLVVEGTERECEAEFNKIKEDLERLGDKVTLLSKKDSKHICADWCQYIIRYEIRQ